MPSPIRYRVTPKNPDAHVFEVTCEVVDPDPAGQAFRMPSWTPGSYLIREFARNVVQAWASAGERPVRIAKTAKDTWLTEPVDGPLLVRYEVYGWDLSVRAAHLDRNRGFFNGPALFVEVVGKADRQCVLELCPPPAATPGDWQVATALERVDGAPFSFGTFRADDYDALLDHPVEMGRLALGAFELAGVRHDIAIAGRHDADLERFARDARRVCAEHHRLFGGTEDAPLPFSRYLFQVLALGEGYGGLEHRNSTSLICSRAELPRAGDEGVSEGYRTFLGLLSHEYFHAWHVKRIKPVAFVPYDLARENYTGQLWVFEGFTSYYDDLALVRSGLIPTSSYLELVGRTASSVLRGSGRLKQSVADSSFDAWIKFYRQDENAPNAIVNYYAKGSLVALGLDLTLRSETATSLDAVMRALWERYGRTGVGVPEDGVPKLVAELAGRSLDEFFERYVYGTEDPPLAELMARFGLRFALRPAEGSADKGGTPPAKGKAARVALGARFASGAEPTLSVVHDGGAAQAGGLSAGDVLVAIDGLRVRAGAVDEMLRRYSPGDRIRVHAFRRDELLEAEVELKARAADTCWIEIDPSATGEALRLRRDWLQRGD
jgi:predicted metalloprotease with PDZ domain